MNRLLTPRRAIALYAGLFSLFIGWASLRAAFGKNEHGTAGHWLASVELVGALLFAWRQTRTIGLVILLSVFVMATVIELHFGLWSLRFIFYAASALLVQYLSRTLPAD